MAADEDNAGRFASHLAEEFAQGRTTAVTWVNHYTAPLLLREKEALAQIDLVGVDGILLAKVLGGVARTSADLVIPLLLPMLGRVRLVTVGGTPESSRAAREALSKLCSDGQFVAAFDGYGGLPPPDALCAQLAWARAEVCIVGLGGGLQDRYAATIRAAGTIPLTLTCGGFLDQISAPAYYPSWAYKWRLNWAVRLAREPRRLWRRYTVEAARFLYSRQKYRSALQQVDGVRRYREIWET